MRSKLEWYYWSTSLDITLLSEGASEPRAVKYAEHEGEIESDLDRYSLLTLHDTLRRGLSLVDQWCAGRSEVRGAHLCKGRR